MWPVSTNVAPPLSVSILEFSTSMHPNLYILDKIMKAIQVSTTVNYNDIKMLATSQFCKVIEKFNVFTASKLLKYAAQAS